jgi:LysR family transcriptional regulator, benzoate and cis,cis-muconate-responsive activator of ben and cat genes
VIALYGSAGPRLNGSEPYLGGIVLELRQLRYFVAVARERNFTRAAKLMNIAQPPLSRQIQALEDEMGSALFERGSRPIRLTEPGQMFFDQAVQVLERVDGMKTMMGQLRAVRRQRLNIGFVASTLYGYLPECVRRYREARPDVDVAFHELTTLEQMAALKEGRIDVGFGRIEFNDPAVERTLLRNEKLSVALYLSHRASSRLGALKLDELAGDTLIVYPRAPRPSYADQVLALFRDRGVRAAAVHEVKELQTALGLVAAESGVCLVPASVERLRRDNVVYRALDEPGAVSPVIMSMRKGDRNPEISIMLRVIREMYRKAGLTFGV